MPYMAAVENVIGSLFCRAGSMVGEAVSSTLQVLRCTELSHRIDVEGQSLPKFDVRVTIAVGTRVTSRPPHRSVRAQFRHTAPTSGV